MEAAHQRLSNACVLVSKAAGTLEVACAEYEAAHLTLKRWWVRHVVSCISQFVLTLLELFPCLLGKKKQQAADRLGTRRLIGGRTHGAKQKSFLSWGHSYR